jgi:hypothetical protein
MERALRAEGLTASGGSPTGLLLLVALGVGFSPTLIDLCQHWWDHSWARYSLVFLLLLIHVCAHHAPVKPRPALGAGLIVAGLSWQGVAIVESALPLARPAVALAAAGFLLVRGACSLRYALLAFLIVPNPQAVLEVLGDDALAMAELLTAATALAPLGLEFGISRHFVDHAGTRIVVDSIHNGVVLGACLMGLGWYRAARLELGPAATVRVLIILGLCVLPLQLLTQAVGLLVLAGGWPMLASPVLHTGGWLVSSVVVVAMTEWQASAAARPLSPAREVSSRAE